MVQLSGGEPTPHPDFFAILDAAKARPIRHLMINTNGLATGPGAEFVAQLAAYKPGTPRFICSSTLAQRGSCSSCGRRSGCNPRKRALPI